MQFRRPVAVSELRVQQKCGLGCPLLDAFLRGGIPCGTVTEIVGECGSGKTLLSLQLLLSVQSSLARGGLQGRALCIYTEGRFPSGRLLELASFACGHADGLITTCLEHCGAADDEKASSRCVATLDDTRLGSVGHVNVEDECEIGNLLGEKRISRNGDFERGYVLGQRNLRRREDDQTGIVECQRLDRAAGKENYFFSAVQETPLSFGRGRTVQKDYERCIEGNYARIYAKQRLGDGQRLSMQEMRGSQTSSVRKEHLHCLKARRLCEKVLVKEVQTIDELLHLLNNQILELLRHRFLVPVKLVVIDSVAALFRTDFDNNKTDRTKRATLFFRFSAKLKQYAQQFNIAIVVTNQVVDCFDEEQSHKQDMERLLTSGRFVRPALGLSWSNCINTRLFLSRVSQECSVLQENQEPVKHGSKPRERHNTGEALVGRKLQVVFAPHLPRDSCTFTVTRRGMQAVPLSGANGTPW